MTSAGTRDMAVLPIVVVVRSQTDPGVTYQVQLPYCPCPDFEHRRADTAEALDSGDIDRLFCKHLREGIRRVAGWHRQPEPVGFENISRTELRDLLLSSLVQMPMREVQALMGRAQKSPDGSAPFSATLAGAVVSGTVTTNLMNGRWAITLHPAR